MRVLEQEVLGWREVDLDQQVAGALQRLGVPAHETVMTQRRGHRVEDRVHRIERGIRVLVDVLDRAAVLAELVAVHAPDVLALEAHGAAGWPTQTGRDLGAGGLARAAFADQADHLAGLDRQ